MDDRRLLKEFVTNHWPYYLLAVILIIASNIDQAALPRVLGQFTDALQQGDVNKADIIHYSVLLLAIGVSYGILFGLGQYTVMRMGRKFEFTTRQTLFRKFSSLSEHYFFQTRDRQAAKLRDERCNVGPRIDFQRSESDDECRIPAALLYRYDGLEFHPFFT